MEQYLDLTQAQWQGVAVGAAAVALILALMAIIAARRARRAQSDAAALRERLAGLAPQAERAAAMEARAEALMGDLYQEQITAAALEQKLVSLQETHEQRLADMTDMKKQLEDRFHALASGALSAN